MSLWLEILEDAVFSAIPAVGFAMVFNVPTRALWMCAVGGAMAHATRTLLMGWGLPIEFSTLIGATSMGMLGVYWSRRYLIPRQVFCIAAVIPMIPGKFAFTAMIALLKLRDGYSAELMEIFVSNGLKGAFVIMALSFGIALPSIIFFRHRPVV